MKLLKEDKYIDSMAERLNEKVKIDFDYDFRGWILQNGEIISTNNAPHFEKEHKVDNQDTAIRYNFGYERYIGLPKDRLTNAQYETLQSLLDLYFVGRNGVGELSSNIEINCDMNNKGDFVYKSYSPFEYTTDDIIKLIKRYYTTGKLVESIESNTFKCYSAGYIKPDGKFIFMDEYHGEDPKYRDLKLPEFSDTHYSDDTCIRLYQEPNDIQYTKLEYIINKYLDEHGYTKIEIWNNNQHIFYEIYSLYEGACYDHHIKENVGNWTGYKLISKIKQLFNRGR